MTLPRQHTRARREALRLTQRELCALCGIRIETLSRVENGKIETPVYLATIMALLEQGEANVVVALAGVGLPRHPPPPQEAKPA
jgi:transcriptional regulator with XRE-family HTH domain